MTMRPGAQPRKRTNWITGGVSIAFMACVAVFVLLLVRRYNDNRSPARDPAPSVNIAPSQGPDGPVSPPSPNRRLLPSLPMLPTTTTTAAAPIIDAVIVEKPEVCEGEENLVTVRAHTPDGNDAFLHYQVGPARGATVALRSFFDNRGKPTVHRVAVFTRGNVATWMDVPPYRVKACASTPVAVIDYRLLANTWADFDLNGKVMVSAVPSRSVTPVPVPFRPRLYRWSFGDGAVIETGTAGVSHSFAARPQDTLYSTFLVELVVVAEDGRLAKARQPLELRNPAFEAFATKHIVQLLVEFEPRFPLLSQEGRVEQGVTIRHTRPEPVDVTSFTVVRRRSGKTGGGNLASAAEQISFSALFGTPTVPPGRGVSAQVVLDAGRDPDLVALDYTIEGRTPTGAAARGSFSVMRPPTRPTQEHHVPVNDPVLVAKIKRARELLHADYVTDEDLWRLERTGQLGGPVNGPAAGLSAPSAAPR